MRSPLPLLLQQLGVLLFSLWPLSEKFESYLFSVLDFFFLRKVECVIMNPTLLSGRCMRSLEKMTGWMWLTKSWYLCPGSKQELRMWPWVHVHLHRL